MNNVIIKNGRSGSKGYAIGKLCIYKRNSYRPPRKKIQDTQAEYLRFETARESALNSLDSMYDRTRMAAGSSNAEIFAAQAMILRDEDYITRIKDNILKDNKNAEWAVSSASRFFYEMFETLDDEVVKSKAQDLKDVSNKLIALLTDTDTVLHVNEPVILAADYISPTELIQIDMSKLKGIVMNEGSAYSHVVILAKTLGIPVVLGVALKKVYDGQEAVVDGTGGKVIIGLDHEIKHRYLTLIDEELRDKSKLREYIGKKAVTRDGRSIEIFANIGRPSDVKSAMENDCEAVGLTRTEFMFLDRDKLPTEEEHFKAYREIVQAMEGRPVVFRTLDLGADKQISAVKIKAEENPALGRRAIRLCLTDKDIFIPQIKGIFRAACYGEVAIMYPMITSVREVEWINEIIEEALSSLRKDGVAYGKVRRGIMIETPAAALISDELAEMVDFFSIGTNDLTQYTLAIDRQNSSLSQFYEPYHDAVMRMIKMTVDNGHKAGIKVAVCGELAGDTTVAERFIDMGVDALSVNPGKILELKRFICEIGT